VHAGSAGQANGLRRWLGSQRTATEASPVNNHRWDKPGERISSKPRTEMRNRYLSQLAARAMSKQYARGKRAARLDNE